MNITQSDESFPLRSIFPPMHRVIVSPDAIQNGCLTIRNASELHHLVHVVRVKVGDEVECFDGQGHGYRGAIFELTRQQIVVHIEQTFREAAPALPVLLAQALIKPERFEWALQKATELGVHQVIPLMTQRTRSQPTARGHEHKVERWRRIAAEAAKQCGRLTLPDIRPPQPFEEFIPTLTPSSLALMPTLSIETRPLKGALHSLNEFSSAIALIGPEGDFTPEEALLAQRHGARPVSLGRLTLRSETAAVATLAILQHEAGAW